MLSNLWWVFVCIGILLMVMEIFTPGFVIMWFGVSFIIAAIPVYFNASTQIIILTFSVSKLGKIMGKIQTFEKYMRYIIAGIFVLVGIYYTWRVWI